MLRFTKCFINQSLEKSFVTSILSSNSKQEATRLPNCSGHSDAWLSPSHSPLTQTEILIRSRKESKKGQVWGLPVVQWLGVHVPMKGTWVWSLVQEDPTSRGATGPSSHNYWAWGPQSPCSATRGATARRSRAPQPESSLGSPRREKALAARKTRHSQKEINTKLYNISSC